MACDLRYAADTAIFTTAFARVAFAGDYGGTWFLTRLVGPAKAKELYYFSERLTADHAEELGLVNAVFPAGDLEKEVMDRARRLAHGVGKSHVTQAKLVDERCTERLGVAQIDQLRASEVQSGETRDARSSLSGWIRIVQIVIVEKEVARD